MTASCVGDDAGRHFKDHHARGKKGIRRKCLGIAQPRIEEKKRIDAPDERSRESMQEQQNQVNVLNPFRCCIHSSRINRR